MSNPAEDRKDTDADAPATQTETPMEDPMTEVEVPPTHAEAASTSQPENGEHRIRVGTVVWGLVLAAIGTGFLAAALGVRFDAELAFIILVAAAGLLLLGGSVATSRRRRG